MGGLLLWEAFSVGCLVAARAMGSTGVVIVAAIGLLGGLLCAGLVGLTTVAVEEDAVVVRTWRGNRRATRGEWTAASRATPLVVGTDVSLVIERVGGGEPAIGLPLGAFAPEDRDRVVRAVKGALRTR